MPPRRRKVSGIRRPRRGEPEGSASGRSHQLARERAAEAGALEEADLLANGVSGVMRLDGAVPLSEGVHADDYAEENAGPMER